MKNLQKNSKKRKLNNHLVYISELRRDPVSNDWVTIASVRAKRPEQLIIKKPQRIVTPKKPMPFWKSSGERAQTARINKISSS